VRLEEAAVSLCQPIVFGENGLVHLDRAVQVSRVCVSKVMISVFVRMGVTVIVNVRLLMFLAVVNAGTVLVLMFVRVAVFVTVRVGVRLFVVLSMVMAGTMLMLVLVRMLMVVFVVMSTDAHRTLSG